MLKVYCARGMTGRIMEEVVKEAKVQRRILQHHGIQVLDPVLEEGVKPKKKKLISSYYKMVKYWKRDKQMIRESDIIFDMTPWLKSEGVSHELGYARYFLWKPIIRVYWDGEKPSMSSIAYFEDDLIVDSLKEAIEESKERWGTFWKRFWWRYSIYSRCWVKAFWYKLKEWF